MAKAAVAAVPAPGAADGAEAPKSKKKLIIIIVAAVLLLAGGGGAAWFFLMKPKAEAGHEEAPAKVEHKGPPAFTIMDPFVVNLAEPDNGRYLQIGITYELTDAKAAEALKTYTPIIRSRILIVLSGKTVNDLSTIEGKQKLMDELVDLARVTVHGDGKDPTNGVRDVHFSSFVIQ